MITKNPMQLKAIIKNRAKELNIIPQAALQVYCLERLLERISLSDKADCFIIKGFNLTKENVTEIFKSICQVQIEVR